MSQVAAKTKRLNRRAERVRTAIAGKNGYPRLSVFRSLNHIYAQIIDDKTGRTLAAASSVGLKMKGGNVEAAKIVGKAIAEKASEASVERVAFDRSGRLFHGRLKALADAAREAGLKF